MKDTSFLRFVDLRDNYQDKKLQQAYLKVFYENILQKYFPIEDELDPIDVLDRGLHSDLEDPILPELHVCLALDVRKTEQDNEGLKRIAGGAVFEYYKMSNCTLLSYFVVTDEYQNLGLGRELVNRAYKISEDVSELYKQMDYRNNTVKSIMHSISDTLNFDQVVTEELKNQFQFINEYIKYTYSDPIKDEFYLFVAETNAVGVSDGIMESEDRHNIMHRIGFRLIDFEYIQPPLSESQSPCADLLLLALQNKMIPKDQVTGRRYVHTNLLKCFMLEFLYSVFENMDGVNDDYLQHVLDDLHSRGQRIFMDPEPALPWMRRTNWRQKGLPPSK
ncbi:hypothetical protein AKO1_007427, partial [Acrasis kona]